MNKRLTINLLNQERERLLTIIREHEFQLQEVDKTIADLEGNTNLDRIYDDQAPDSIKGTEDGI